MCEIIDNGKTRVINNGTDVTIVTSSLKAPEAMKASRTLVVKGISTAVIEVLTLDPLDEDTLMNYGTKTGVMVFIDSEIYHKAKICLKDSRFLIQLIENPSISNIIKFTTKACENKFEKNREQVSNYIHYVR